MGAEGTTPGARRPEREVDHSFHRVQKLRIHGVTCPCRILFTG